MFANIPQKVIPLWYLSALFFVLPLICLLCQIRNTIVKFLIAFYSMSIWYHNLDNAFLGTYPEALYRAFCGMCMGIVAYYIEREISEWANDSEAKKNCLLSLGNLFMASIIIMAGLGKDDQRIQLFFIFLGAVFILSCKKGILIPGNRLTDFCSQFSIVIYILHWTIGVVVNKFMMESDVKAKVFAYYIVTILFSIIMLVMHRIIKEKIVPKLIRR